MARANSPSRVAQQFQEVGKAPISKAQEKSTTQMEITSRDFSTCQRKRVRDSIDGMEVMRKFSIGGSLGKIALKEWLLLGLEMGSFMRDRLSMGRGKARGGILMGMGISLEASGGMIRRKVGSMFLSLGISLKEILKMGRWLLELCIMPMEKPIKVSFREVEDMGWELIPINLVSLFMKDIGNMINFLENAHQNDFNSL